MVSLDACLFTCDEISISVLIRVTYSILVRLNCQKSLSSLLKKEFMWNLKGADDS